MARPLDRLQNMSVPVRCQGPEPTDGDATGLKYLAGKKDCLTVEPGEGYCRD